MESVPLIKIKRYGKCYNLLPQARRYEGPQAGSYKVVIYAERPSGRKLQADEGSSEMVDELVQYIPEIYNVKTTLSVDVSGDRADLNFLLEKPKRTTRRGR